MPSRDIETAYPLSALQQGMLFQHVSSADLAIDVMQVVASLHEDLQLARFRLAWERVVARHPALRTGFRWMDCGEPLQEVHKEVAVLFEVLDWRDTPASEHQDRIAAYLQADRQRGFDLSQPPLRFTVVRLGQDHYKCIWTLHHIIFDGASGATILNEVFSLYEGLCGGPVPELAPVRPFQDYIDWLERQDWSKSERFWRERMNGLAGATQLPPLVPSPDADGHRARRGREGITLTESETSALKSFATASRVTVNTLLNGAWAVLLSRYSGEPDVVFGGTRACRHSSVEGADSIVGLFINTLPIRVAVQNDQPLLPWLQELREEWTSTTPYEHVPLTKVRAWSDVPGQKPLFDSFVVFNNRTLNAILQAKGGNWGHREFEFHAETNLPLAVIAYLAERMEVKIGFDRHRFSDETIRRMLVHLKTIVLSMVDSPQQSLGELRMLPEEERRQILVEWNDTGVDFGACDTLHWLVEQQATLAPDAIAVVFEGQELTYRDLERRANQVANHLRRLGVDTETLVGLCLDRSLDLVVGVLGILKAGGAFVPLDPDLPRARLHLMVKDGKIPIVVTQERSSAQFVGTVVQVVRLDADWQTIEKESRSKPSDRTVGEDLAYVVYTSGSTGTPKAVMNEHRGISNHTLAMVHAFGLGAADVCVLKTPLSFDPWISETFRPLVAGGCLIVARPGGHRDTRYLVDLIHRHSVTYMNFVPSMLREVLEIPDLERCSSLKNVVSGGEALTPDLATRFRSRMAARLHNVYGPAEASVGASLYECKGDESGFTVPIGRPLANTRLYVLDPELKPVPAGVVGELCIAGIHVGRGYLNRPDLTEQRFLPDPFTGDPSAKMYKTGDLVRYQPDGNLEFLGRADHQVKLRGSRIELGEVEAVLGAYKGVQRAVAVVREDQPGDQRLVAYVVPDDGTEPNTADWSEYLQEQLPQYMVPQHLVTLPALPLTPNGKVDRKALPPPDTTVTSDQTYQAPTDPLELQLVQIWHQIFSRRRIGVRDDFFDLGGDSMLAVRLFAEIKKLTGRNLPFVTLFRAPTIHKLADVLRDEGWQAPWSSLVPIQPGGSLTPFYGVHGVGGNILEFFDLARCLGDEQPFYGIQAVGLDGKTPPLSSMEEMAAHYVKEIRQFQPEGPYFLGGSSSGGLVAWEMAHQLQAAGETVGVLAMIDTWAPGYPKAESKTALGRKLRFLQYRYVELYKTNLREVPPSERLRYVLAKAKRATKHLWDAGLGRAFIPTELKQVRKYNLLANAKYVPGTYSGNVILLQATERQPGVIQDPTNGWGEYAAGEIEVRKVRGHHYSVMFEPHVRGLADQLAAILREARTLGARTDHLDRLKTA